MQRFRMCENEQEKGATPVVWGCSDQDGRQRRPLGRLRAFSFIFAGSILDVLIQDIGGSLLGKPPKLRHFNRGC